MPVAIVRLGSPRKANEGVRIGTVRRPPRGVPKAQFAKRLLHRDKPDILQVIDEESELFLKRTHSAEAKQAIARFLK